MGEERAPKAWLVVRSESGEFRVALQGDVVSIGSDPRCTISLPSAGLGAHHWVLQRAPEGFEFFNLAPAGATLLNGQPTEAGAVRAGDQIQAGQARFVFLVGQPEPPVKTPVGPVPEVIPFAPTNAWDRMQENPFFEPGNSDAQVASSLGTPQVDTRPTTGQGDDARTKPPTEGQLASRLLRRGHLLAAARLFGGVTLEPFRRLRERRRLESVAAAPPVYEDPRLTGDVVKETLSRWDLHRREQTFSHALVQSLKRTPYFATSVLFHAAILLLFSFMSTARPIDRPLPPISTGIEGVELTDDVVELADEKLEEIDDTRVDEPDVAEPEIIEPLESVFDSPATSDAPMPGDDASEPFSGVQGLDLGGLSQGGFGIKSLGSKSLQRTVRGLRQSGLEVVFVIDSTGSMGHVLTETRKRIDGMISFLSALIPKFRLGIVTYRDRGDEYVTRELPLTPYYYQAVHFLDGIEAAGGGDQPEGVLDGLRSATDGMRWVKGSRRILILVGDAPPHARDLSKVLLLARAFTQERGTIHTMVTTGANGAAPDPKALSSFATIANAGKGANVLITDSTDIIAKITSVALGSEHEEAMKEARRSMESDWRGKRFAKLLDHADGSEILAHLRSNTQKGQLFHALAQNNQLAFLPAYLAAIEDPKVDKDARWASIVLARRLIDAHSRQKLARHLAANLDISADAKSISSQMTELRRAIRKAGLPDRLVGSSGRDKKSLTRPR